MKPIRVWPDLATGKFWHKDEETGIVTEIAELPVPPAIPTAAEIKIRMVEMRIR